MTNFIRNKTLKTHHTLQDNTKCMFYNFTILFYLKIFLTNTFFCVFALFSGSNNNVTLIYFVPDGFIYILTQGKSVLLKKKYFQKNNKTYFPPPP